MSSGKALGNVPLQLHKLRMTQIWKVSSQNSSAWMRQILLSLCITSSETLFICRNLIGASLFPNTSFLGRTSLKVWYFHLRNAMKSTLAWLGMHKLSWKKYWIQMVSFGKSILNWCKTNSINHLEFLFQSLLQLTMYTVYVKELIKVGFSLLVKLKTIVHLEVGSIQSALKT